MLSHQSSGKALGSEIERGILLAASIPNFSKFSILFFLKQLHASTVPIKTTEHSCIKQTFTPAQILLQHRYFYPIRTNGGEKVPSERSCGIGVAFLVTCPMVPEACHGLANLNCQLKLIVWYSKFSEVQSRTMLPNSGEDKW